MTVREFYKYCEENNLLDYKMQTISFDRNYYGNYYDVDLEFGSNIVTFKDDKAISISNFWGKQYLLN